MITRRGLLKSLVPLAPVGTLFSTGHKDFPKFVSDMGAVVKSQSRHCVIMVGGSMSPEVFSEIRDLIRHEFERAGQNPPPIIPGLSGEYCVKIFEL